jgi:cobalt-zinc-cadmium efflux system outer membrane protein
MRGTLLLLLLILLTLGLSLCAQIAPQPPQRWTWDIVKDHFELNNTALLASRLNIDELKAQEITAHLRPNPDFTLSADGTQIAPSHGVWTPFAGTFVSPGVSYLFERRNKRGLRFEAAKQGTAIGVAQQSDSERTLLFNLRTAFVGVLQAKAVLHLAQDNLDSYDKILTVSRERFHAGDIARIDLDRLELQRLQYESDRQTALVNLRTTKINLLALLDDRRPVDSFDVDGPYDFHDDLLSLDDYRKEALDARPDLRAAVLTVKQAETNYQLAEADGSTDPTVGVWFTHNGSFNNPDALNTIGASVNIPLRIFDRNQGEKERTRYEAQSTRFAEIAVRNQVINDVDQAWAGYQTALRQSQRYNGHYLAQASRVRDNLEFSYRHGGSTLLDYLDALRDYRQVNLDALNANVQVWLGLHQLSYVAASEMVP